MKDKIISTLFFGLGLGIIIATTYLSHASISAEKVRRMEDSFNQSVRDLKIIDKAYEEMTKEYWIIEFTDFKEPTLKDEFDELPCEWGNLTTHNSC